MNRRLARFAALNLALALFLGGCASSPESVPFAITNTNGTTTVNGTEVPYEYNGEFYILAGDMLFHTLEDLRSYVDAPFGGMGSLQAAQVEGPNGALNPGNSWYQGRIPFQITDYSSSSNEYNVIAMAMVHWEQETGIRFYPSTTNSDRLVIERVASTGCRGSATIGQNDGSVFPRNQMEISDDCNASTSEKRTQMLALVRHELGHVIGFYHEHQRKNRVDHVDYNPENATSGSSSAFSLLFDSSNSFIPTGYDFDSIMHYDPYAFSKDPGNPSFRTLERKGDPSYPLGSSTVSDPDVYSTERYYANQAPCGYLNVSYPQNCRYLAYDLSTSSKYYQFTNSTFDRVHLAWLISDDYHPDSSKANLSYRLELQQLVSGSWRTIAQSASSQRAYVSISKALNSGTYRWAYLRLSGQGFADTYRTYEP